MNPEIRWARPDDAALLAWVMLMAGRSHLERGIWDIIIGRPEDECLTFLEHLSITDEPHMCHHSIFLVAEVDGRPAAALSGYDPENLGEETVAPQMPIVMERMGLTDEDMAAGGARCGQPFLHLGDSFVCLTLCRLCPAFQGDRQSQPKREALLS